MGRQVLEEAEKRDEDRGRRMSITTQLNPDLEANHPLGIRGAALGINPRLEAQEAQEADPETTPPPETQEADQ